MYGYFKEGKFQWHIHIYIANTGMKYTFMYKSPVSTIDDLCSGTIIAAVLCNTRSTAY